MRAYYAPVDNHTQAGSQRRCNQRRNRAQNGNR